jgi:phosphoglycerate kinase
MDSYPFQGKKVLVRVDFNVPMDENQRITDDTRMVTAIPTLRKILTEKGAVILLTHLGRPGGKKDSALSLRHIIPRLSQLLEREVRFASDCIGAEAARMAADLEPGQVLLLENLRFHPGETAGDEDFAAGLAALGDTYVNDAFGTAHRAHASTYTIARFFPDDRMFGYLVESEIQQIDKVLKEARHPFTAILGGSKVSTKIGIIEALLDKVDHLLIGGGIAFTFARAMGGQIGDSIVETEQVKTAERILVEARKRRVQLHLPSDCLVADRFTNDAEIEHTHIMSIRDGWMGLDIGVKTVEEFSRVIEDSATILWNGPMGAFEMNHFANGTLRVALAVARATDKGAFSLVGGGDSIAALNRYSLAHKISYISTAGGALLEYLEGKNLPSIRAIRQSYSIDDYNFRDQRALIRVDFNVPLDEQGHITDDTRMVTAIPTIRRVLADGGSAVIMTHLGRPGGKPDPALSTRIILPHLEKLLERPVHFQDPSVGDAARSAARKLRPGEVMLLENLRFYPGEKSGDEAFARSLSELGDVYVNDAFGTAHRAHASTFTVARFFSEHRMLGYLVESEINRINRVLNRAEPPFTAILGGSKVSTKIGIIRALLEKVDRLIVGGGVAYTFVRALGGEVGASLVEEDYLDVARGVIDRARELGVRLELPVDCVIADRMDNEAAIEHRDIREIPSAWMGLDIGVRTVEAFGRLIETSRTILWNGPMGVFEMPHFSNGTLRIALSVARATDKGAFSLVGGGDSIAALNRYSLAHKVSYISTAGGALLEYLEGRGLPSLRAIRGEF